VKAITTIKRLVHAIGMQVEKQEKRSGKDKVFNYKMTKNPLFDVFGRYISNQKDIENVESMKKRGVLSTDDTTVPRPRSARNGTRKRKAGVADLDLLLNRPQVVHPLPLPGPRSPSPSPSSPSMKRKPSAFLQRICM
jgi:hypothetical protein